MADTRGRPEDAPSLEQRLVHLEERVSALEQARTSGPGEKQDDGNAPSSEPSSSEMTERHRAWIDSMRFETFEYYCHHPGSLAQARKREALLNRFLRSSGLEPEPIRLPTDEDVAKAIEGVSEWSDAHGSRQ